MGDEIQKLLCAVVSGDEIGQKQEVFLYRAE